jgi:hypothetical protein
LASLPNDKFAYNVRKYLNQRDLAGVGRKGRIMKGGEVGNGLNQGGLGPKSIETEAVK